MKKGKYKKRKAFYRHMDGSWCCSKCHNTLEEGCECYDYMEFEERAYKFKREIK